MQITFLGTSCMVPTKKRNPQAIFLSYGSEGILLDCGEGTQRQMKIGGVKPTKITKILISHWHGDHVLGLPGLLQTMAASEYDRHLDIYGPIGTKQHFDYMFKAFVFDNTLDYTIHEVKDKVFFDSKEFSLEAFALKHGVKCLGYNFLEKDKYRINLPFVRKLGIPDGPLLGRLQRGQDIEWKGKKIPVSEATKLVEGKKISFIMDTDLCQSCYDMAQDADLLVCESVYCSAHEDKAEKNKHMTAKNAALIASSSNVKKLVLTHFSQRYKNTQEIEEEASMYFDEVVCAEDFMKIRL